MILALQPSVELVLQPYGSVLVDRSRQRFDVLNATATGLLLHLRKGISLDAFHDAGSVAGHSTDALDRLLDGLEVKGHLRRLDTQPADGPTVSYAHAQHELKAVRAEIELTNRCNLRCTYCYAEVNTSKEELTADEWILVMNAMHQHGLRAALFSGGEPFLHRGLMDILAWAAERLIVEMNTNGAFITPAHAQRLAKLDLKVVQVSMDSATPEYHDSVRGRGSHAKALAGVRHLADAGVPVQLSATVTRRNRPMLPELARLARELGVAFKGDPVTRTGFAKEIDDQTWEEQFAASDSDRVASKSAAELALEGFEPICQSQVGLVAVSHLGILKPCNMRESFFQPTGSALLHHREDRWWETWYGKTRLAAVASTATEVPAQKADQLRSEHVGFLCELQLAALDQGATSAATPGERTRLPLTVV